MTTKLDKKFLKKYSKLSVKVSTLNLLLKDPDLYDEKTKTLKVSEEEFMGILYATDKLIIDTDVFTQVVKECEKIAKDSIKNVTEKDLKEVADLSNMDGFREHVIRTYRSNKVILALNDAEERIGNADFSCVKDKKDAIIKMSNNLLGSLMNKADVDVFSNLMFEKLFA